MRLNHKDARTLLATVHVSGGQIPPRRISHAIRHGAPLADLLREAERCLIDSGEGVRDGELIFVGTTHGVTLKAALEPVLAGNLGSRQTRAFVKRAVQVLYDLPPSALLPDLIAACENTAIADAYAVPQRVYDRGLAMALSQANARNMRAHLRTALEQAAIAGMPFSFPAAWLEVSEQGDVTGLLLHALAALWIDGQLPTRDAIHARCGINPASVNRRLEKWSAQGRVHWRETDRGRELRLLNLSGCPAAKATLATVLTAVHEREPLSVSQNRQLFGVVRRYLGLPERHRMRVSEIIEAAATIDQRQLQNLPDDLHRWALAEGNAKGSADTWRSTVRAALVWAARQSLIPLSWRGGIEAEWDSVRDEWLPGGRGTTDGVKASTRACHRTAWGWLREAVVDMQGSDASPAILTDAITRSAQEWLRKRGRFDHAAGVSAALNFAGRRGYGPRAGLDQPTSILLGGDEQQQAYDGFLRLLTERNLRPEWREFFQWYWVYSTADWTDLVLGDYPSRPPARQLKEGTMLGRARSVRWVLGLLERDGWDITALTLADVFAFDVQHNGRSIGLRRVFALAQQLWRTRHESGELAAPVGSSIRGYVTSAGLIAEALYMKMKHDRGESVARLSDADRANRPRHGIDIEQEESAVRTVAEERLWKAYRHSREVGDRLKREARGWGDNETANTTKDLAKLILLTPSSWFTRLQERYLEIAWRSIHRDGASREHHELIRDAFLNGLLVSTGFRGEELVNLRVDVHLPSQAFDRSCAAPIGITLNRWDRKNSVSFTGQLFSEYVPGWLRDAYLNHSRPWLMRQLKRTSDHFTLQVNQQHQHLLVDNAGRAFGCPCEQPRGAGRLGKKHIEKNVGRLRTMWQNRSGRVAWEQCGLTCPIDPGYYTLHTVRNSRAAAIYLTQGEQAAANWLGDSVTSVRGHYGRLDGSAITEDMMIQAGAVGGLVVSETRVAPDTSELIRRLRELGVTDDVLGRAVKERL